MKPSDLYFPNSLDLSNEPPFIRVPDDSELSGSSSICPSFKENGHCRQGYKCRFLGTHVTQSSSDSIPVLKDASNVDGSPIDTNELNATRPGLFKLLRTRKVQMHCLRSASKIETCIAVSYAFVECISGEAKSERNSCPRRSKN